jgi:hypothetical protein
MIKLILNNSGHFLNLIGGILIAISVSAHPYGAHVPHNGKILPIAVIKSTSFFWTGLSLMIAGFFISIAYSIGNYIYKNKTNKAENNRDSNSNTKIQSPECFIR